MDIFFHGENIDIFEYFHVWVSFFTGTKWRISIKVLVFAEGRSLLKLKGPPFHGLSLIFGHILSFNLINQSFFCFQATNTPLLKTTCPQNYQNTTTTKQVQKNNEKGIILGLLTFLFLLYRVRSKYYHLFSLKVAFLFSRNPLSSGLHDINNRLKSLVLF